jgi:hypothetical protein
MKKIILLTAFFLTFNVYAQTLAIFPVENDAVVFKEVIELGQQYTDEEIFQAVKEWSISAKAEYYRKIGGDVSRLNKIIPAIMPLLTETPVNTDPVRVHPSIITLEANYRTRDPLKNEIQNKSIALEVTQHYQSGSGNVNTLFINSTLRIDVKDGKYRYSLVGFDYQHWNQFTGNQIAVWPMGTKKNKEACDLAGTIATLQNLCTKATRSRKTALTLLRDDIDTFILNMKDEIKNNIELNEEDDNW